MSYQEMLDLAKKEAFIWSFPQLTEKQKQAELERLQRIKEDRESSNFSKN